MQLSKFVLLVFTLLISSQITWAQTTKNDTISLIPKWEVGLNLLSLFNEGNVPKASIFFRRNYAISNQKCKALRFRIGLDSEIRDGYTFEGLLTGEYKTYTPYLSIGHEWKQAFKRYN